MQITDIDGFNRKLRNTLWAGTLVYLLFTPVMYLICDKNPLILQLFALSSLFFILNASLLTSRLKLNPHLGSSWVVFVNYTLAAMTTTACCHLSQWPKGSFITIFVICLALMELRFIVNRKIAKLQFVLSFALGTSVFSLANDPSNLRFEFLFGFITISMWKYINDYYFNNFLKKYDKNLKIKTYEELMGTLKHELNNTSTIILGISNHLRKKPSHELEDLDKLDNSIHRMVKQINHMDNFEGISSIHERNREHFNYQ